MATTLTNQTPGPIPDGMDPADRRTSRTRPLFDPPIVRRALGDAFKKLDPRLEAKNPVMFVVWIGSVVTTLIFLASLIPAAGVSMGGWERAFTGQIALWLWFTVLFANFAEAIAKGRGKAQADELRKTRTTTRAKRLGKDGKIEEVPAVEWQVGNLGLGNGDGDLAAFSLKQRCAGGYVDGIAAGANGEADRKVKGCADGKCDGGAGVGEAGLVDGEFILADFEVGEAKAAFGVGVEDAAAVGAGLACGD